MLSICQWVCTQELSAATTGYRCNLLKLHVKGAFTSITQICGLDQRKRLRADTVGSAEPTNADEHWTGAIRVGRITSNGPSLSVALHFTPSDTAALTTCPSNMMGQVYAVLSNTASSEHMAQHMHLRGGTVELPARHVVEARH